MKLTHRLDKAVSDYLGEQLTLVPTIEGEFMATPDETRQGGNFFGHLMLTKESADVGGRGSEWNGRVAVSGAILKVGENELPDGAVVQQGDVIVALERDDRAFKVTNVAPKLGGFEIELGDAG